jgi:hypothetical protein
MFIENKWSELQINAINATICNLTVGGFGKRNSLLVLHTVFPHPCGQGFKEAYRGDSDVIAAFR